MLKEEDICIINSIMCRYGKPNPEENTITIFRDKSIYREITTVNPISDIELEKYRM